jgi:hypothetical protein
MAELPQLNFLRRIACLHVSNDIPEQAFTLLRVHQAK